MNAIDTMVVGGGQAGLAVSHELGRAGVGHVVVERGRVGDAWRRRWKSFCLVTPNWSVQLPGHPYDGDDPDGFMSRDEIVAYLERYAARFDVPIHEGVQVTSVESLNGGGFLVDSSEGRYRAESLVLATGAFQRPHRPAGADTLPNHVVQLDVDEYWSPEDLPQGGVLIVGSGQTGCQIAEELYHAGRRVALACGRAPWAPRRIADRDLVWWLLESGFMDGTVDSLPSPRARLAANVLATGHDGGHDLNLRTLRELGVTLTGRFLGSDAKTVRFAPDLAESVAWGDERHEQLMNLFRSFAKREGYPVPDEPSPTPFEAAMPEALALSEFGTILFTGGFRPDFASWLPWSGAFDDDGFPIQKDGTSAVVEGLHFVGIHFVRKRKSSLLIGVGEDAAIVARTVANRTSPQ
jgi:putative flavoprotein involved in K+ transport